MLKVVSSCPKNVAVSKSLEELAREASRVQGQPIGKEEGSETSDESWALPVVPKFARVVSRRRHDGLRMLIDRLICRDGNLEDSLLK